MRDSESRNVMSLKGTCIPLGRQPVFEEYATGALPVSEDLCAKHVCLSIFSGMQEADAHQVLDALRQVIG
jgi:dTDP-4-amino-4,6-dideoxygalactose transaminase